LFVIDYTIGYCLPHFSTTRPARSPLEAHMIHWETAVILILIAFILGMFTAIRLLKA
jgi:hypothetical protein